VKAVSERDTHVGFSSQSFSDGGSTPPASKICVANFVLSLPRGKSFATNLVLSKPLVFEGESKGSTFLTHTSANWVFAFPQSGNSPIEIEAQHVHSKSARRGE
jgi:hypothetical protein